LTCFCLDSIRQIDVRLYEFQNMSFEVNNAWFSRKANDLCILPGLYFFESFLDFISRKKEKSKMNTKSTRL